MNAKKVFRKAWLWLGIVSWLSVILVIATACLFFEWNLALTALSTLVPILIWYLRWNNRLEVPIGWEFVYQWNGQRIEPLKPGLYYPFYYFDMLSSCSEVLMKSQKLNILTGVRTGLSPELVETYNYGSPTNIEPKTGDYVRLMYAAEVKCHNSQKMAYEKTDPFGFIVGLLEQEVIIYIKTLDNEGINDYFVGGIPSAEWILRVTTKLAPIILNEVGMELLRFIPIDVLNTPETEASRRKVEEKKREKEVLKAELSNMTEKKLIGIEADSIATHAISAKIEAIKTKAGVNGVVALKYLAHLDTTQGVVQASQKGNITYMSDAGNSKLTDSFALGWGLNAHQKNDQVVPVNSADKDDEEADENNNGPKKPKQKVVVNKKKN